MKVLHVLLYNFNERQPIDGGSSYTNVLTRAGDT